jgi:hypothetical protein
LGSKERKKEREIYFYAAEPASKHFVCAWVPAPSNKKMKSSELSVAMALGYALQYPLRTPTERKKKKIKRDVVRKNKSVEQWA